MTKDLNLCIDWDESNNRFTATGNTTLMPHKNLWDTIASLGYPHPVYTTNPYVAYESIGYATEQAKKKLAPLHNRLLERSNVDPKGASVQIEGRFLHGYQLTSYLMLEKYKYGIITHPPRSGKTTIIGALIRLKGVKCAVVVSVANAVRKGGTWEQELNLLTPRHNVIVSSNVDEMTSHMRNHKDYTIYLLTANALRSDRVQHHLRHLPIELICIDEIHKDFGKTSNKSVKALINISSFGESSQTLEYLIGMSGSVFNSVRTARVRALLAIFSKRVFDSENGIRSQESFFRAFNDNSSSSEELYYPTVVMKYLKANLLIVHDHFDRGFRKFFDLKSVCEANKREEYERSSANLQTLLHNQDLLKGHFDLKAQKMWHETACGELGENRIINTVKEVRKLERGGHKKIIIAFWHRNIGEGVAKELNSPVVHGGVTGDDRAEVIRKFREDPDQHYFIAQTDVMACNLLLDNASVVFFSELYWMPDKIEQASHRQTRHDGKGGKKLVQVLINHGMDVILLGRISYHHNLVAKMFKWTHDECK